MYTIGEKKTSKEQISTKNERMFGKIFSFIQISENFIGKFFEKEYFAFIAIDLDNKGNQRQQNRHNQKTYEILQTNESPKNDNND